MAHCPEPERLAAYLDGRLFPEQRERLEEHLAACDGCANAIAEAMRFDALTSPAPARAHRGRWVAAAALAVVAPTAAWLALGSERPPWRSDPRAPLIAATAEARPLLPRLTGGFRWAPPRETVRAVSPTPKAVSWSYYAAAEEVRRNAVAMPSADRLGALADAHLLAGDLDRALATLARATADDPDDPGLRSDFAAAYLARGQQNDAAADLALAIELASDALAADPSLIEARFNRALALEALHLGVEAQRAWESYLRDEKDPRWIAEAEQHLSVLRAARARPLPSAADLRRAAERNDTGLPALVAAHRFNARRLVEWELLPTWGAAVEAGDRAAGDRALIVAERVARLYAAQTGEVRLADQVAEAKGARDARAHSLAAAHRALAKGEADIERIDGAAAREELARAAASFPPRSVGWRRATSELLIAEFVAKGRVETLAVELQRRVALGGDDAVTRARLAWLEGMMAANRSETGKAIGRYLESLAAFDRVGEMEPTAWIRFLLSEVYTLAGDERSSWQHRSAAVATVPTLDDGRRSYGILLGAAMWSVLGGRPWLADAFLDELTARGYATLPYQRAQLLLWRGRVSLALGDRSAGTAELAQAALATREIEQEVPRQRLGAELAAARAITASSPTQAVATLSRALAGFRDRGSEPRLPGLLLQRSLAYRLAGDTAASERDLREGIEILERQPRLANRDEVWLSRLDGAHALYDQMMTIELGRNRGDQAFEWSERARRRVLGVHGAGAASITPIALARISGELDPGTTLLSYALVGDEVLLWAIDARGSRLVPLRTPAREVASWVAMLDADLAAGEWTAQSARVARRLYRALVAPAALDPGTRRLVVVPDKGLATLPFSALLDDDGSFLVQRFTVEVAPSAAFYLHARERWQTLAGDRPSALVLGDPRADETLFPGLTPLPGAAEESRQVAALYPGSRLVTRERATRAALVDGLERYAIVHLATHALVDEASPSRSAIALAPRRSGDGSGALFADEISGLPLARVRTVVLASCGGTVGPAAQPDSRLSLPRAFLSADVPTVVAALWPVGDRRSVELLAGLHAGLRAGDDPASALRSAQLRLLASRDPRLSSPATWALFQVLGG